MKFDHDMGEQQNELETLQEEFAEETEQLKELEERLEVIIMMINTLITLYVHNVHVHVGADS